jgi:sialic acid synthase SpsE/quercetin dioxygenase-like cupin family protein
LSGGFPKVPESLFENLFVFEMANNHQGSRQHGLNLIAELAKIKDQHGINAAVKFQYRDLETFVHKDADDSSNKHIKRFRETAISDDDFIAMIEATRAAGMKVMITPFDERSVTRAIAHGVDILKIASCSAKDTPLLAAAAATGKPLICSTGGCDVSTIDALYAYLKPRCKQLAILHCVALYPTPATNLHMNFIDRMMRRYEGVTIGYSGHEDPADTSIVTIAAAKSCRIFERHVGLPTETVALNGYSMNPAQVSAWVSAALHASAACGPTQDKVITEGESSSLLDLSRGIFAGTAIPDGDPLIKDQLYIAFPRQPGQAAPGTLPEGAVATLPYEPHAPIQQICDSADIDYAEQHMATFRAMFNEAGVRVLDPVGVELSHHFGLENFSETGALLITAVNGEYCKKVIAMLPGQNHPEHTHTDRDETFHLLWGDLNLVLDGKAKQLRIGELVTIKRGTGHSFSSLNGAILDEITGSYEGGTSSYSNPEIQKMGNDQRKTKVLRW